MAHNDNNYNPGKADLDDPGKQPAQHWLVLSSHPMVRYRLHHLAWILRNGLKLGQW